MLATEFYYNSIMRFVIPKLAITPQYFLRKCGYIEIRNPHKDFEISYARSLDPGRFYPRLHIYIEPDNNGIGISIHLDAKKPSYEGSSAHSGEYDSPLVKEESLRIQNLAKDFRQRHDMPVKTMGFSAEKSWWRKIFGI
mgnify:FL=1